jgi:hypothetical protein
VELDELRPYHGGIRDHLPSYGRLDFLLQNPEEAFAPSLAPGGAGVAQRLPSIVSSLFASGMERE